ncbi:isopentenyl-diphosphate Delta-isomerase I-like protein [Corchorus olitorius]|uniref:Isopentenyl-diphosphate Delta-isomerase I-like protein n=1 Tax=Corchorus olitorius TaxID=93759 RepID=A0A1R3FXQ9_9ROSI|nr:isopentenyl-diphosphate Delta-isomerase I-like protein [Corchorus olitorius]
MPLLLNTSSALGLSRSLASSLISPRPQLSLSSSFTLPTFPSARVSLSFRARAYSATVTAMGDAPDAGMDAVQRRLMFEDESLVGKDSNRKDAA